MDERPVSEGVQTLLKELHQKKVWLDMMIQGLEAAMESPEHQLIARVEEAYEGASQSSSARAELQSDRRAALAVLARHVKSSPKARRRRSLQGRQAVRT